MGATGRRRREETTRLPRGKQHGEWAGTEATWKAVVGGRSNWRERESNVVWAGEKHTSEKEMRGEVYYSKHNMEGVGRTHWQQRATGSAVVWGGERNTRETAGKHMHPHGVLNQQEKK